MGEACHGSLDFRFRTCRQFHSTDPDVDGEVILQIQMTEYSRNCVLCIELGIQRRSRPYVVAAEFGACHILPAAHPEHVWPDQDASKYGTVAISVGEVLSVTFDLNICNRNDQVSCLVAMLQHA